MSYVLVFIGGGLGSAFRLAVNRCIATVVGAESSLGTFIVNVVGSYAMGVLVALMLTRDMGDHPLRLFLATGVLGGFTTFSAFSLDAVVMWQRGEWPSFVIYVASSLLCSILALSFGFATMRFVG